MSVADALFTEARYQWTVIVNALFAKKYGGRRLGFATTSVAQFSQPQGVEECLQVLSVRARTEIVGALLADQSSGRRARCQLLEFLDKSIQAAAPHAAVLAALLGDEDSAVCLSSVRVLRRLGAEAAPHVAQIFQDEEARFDAADVLCHIGEAARPHVIPLLDHPDEDTRVAACTLLRRLGTTALVAAKSARARRNERKTTARDAACHAAHVARASSKLPDEDEPLMTNLDMVASRHLLDIEDALLRARQSFADVAWSSSSSSFAPGGRSSADHNGGSSVERVGMACHKTCKQLLFIACSKILERPIHDGDIAFKTEWCNEGVRSSVSAPCLHPICDTWQWVGDVCASIEAAEQSAAIVGLDALRAQIACLLASQTGSSSRTDVASGKQRQLKRPRAVR